MTPLRSVRRRLLVLTALAAVLVTVASCSRGPAPTPALHVVTTSNILADWVRHVGGDRIEVFSLVPVGSDSHTFQPGVRDITRLAQADLVFTVGLGLEAAWLEKLVRNAATDTTKVVVLGEMVDPVASESHEDGGEGEEGKDEHGLLDPHFWFDPVRVKVAVREMAARLSALDRAGADHYTTNTQTYLQELDRLDAWIQEQVARVPFQRRALVTSHDSLGYFARRYGFRIVGTVIPRITTEREPSAQEMARLVEQVRRDQVPAIFTESTLSDRLARRMASEAGVRVVRSLYIESLGRPGSGADTYIDLVRTNVKTIVEALK